MAQGAPVNEAAPHRDPTPAEAPWPGVAEKVGAIARVRVAGRMGSTFFLDTERGKLVAKRMPSERDPERYLDLLGRLSEMPAPFCPRPLGAVIADETCWYALFEWIDGATPPFGPDEAEPVWESTLGLLKRMRSAAVVSEWALESIWIERLEGPLSDEPAASFLLSRLRRSPLEGPRTLVHGDFSLQNFVRSAGRLVLVDWEEPGSAPPGFDAGWMLALARMGAGPPQGHRVLAAGFLDAGFPEPNLVWFEALGLLRLLFRARSLPIADGVRALLLGVLRQVVHERAEATRLDR
ncbi:aminoglycoside phosphotransferase family protein [Sorangium sp. So ce1000]|uniref:aminoglycoside phosphotransferase family protein n=1 Tax=Sorangium sp. So ce1000 TaxID=3133325 RepID=UPI003F60F2F7